eukprot:scaffold49725_cov55-Phaeocystis_antarctica.AAC.3
MPGRVVSQYEELLCPPGIMRVLWRCSAMANAQGTHCHYHYSTSTLKYGTLFDECTTGTLPSDLTTLRRSLTDWLR